ncbi:monocarboxylate transporter 12-like [Watersipora subatra]|uniref:monocarboxylate transporter 12-like n=1 Tax=Watersipora subatra TaxID=2589382 RepID=UPI00355BCF4D
MSSSFNGEDILEATPNNISCQDEDIKTSETGAPPDGGWGWVVTLASFINHCILDGIFYSLGLFLIEYAAYFHVSIGLTSLISSLLIGSSYLIGLIGAPLIKIYGCRNTGLAASLIGSLSIALSSLAPNLHFLSIMLGFVGGCSFGVIYLQSAVIVGQYFEKKRAMATGMATSGAGIGVLGIVPLTKLLLDEYSWKGAQLFIAGLLLQCCITCSLMTPLPRRSVEAKEDTSIETNSSQEQLSGSIDGSRLIYDSKRSFDKNSNFVSEQELVTPVGMSNIFISGSACSVLQGNSCLPSNFSSQSNTATYFQKDEKERQTNCLPKPVADVIEDLMDWSVLKCPGILMLGVANVFVIFGHFVPIIFIVPKAIEMGISLADGAFILSLMGILNTAGRLLLSLLANIPGVSVLLVNNVAITLAGVSVITLPFCTDFLSMTVVVCSYAFLIASYSCLFTVIICNLVGLEKLTNVLSFLNLLKGVTAIVGPPLLGKLFDLTGKYDMTMYTGGAFIMLSGLMQFTLHLPYCKKMRK